ncbi:MAG: hypothetical protein RLY86_1908 [Pseudomonadota bacterium]
MMPNLDGMEFTAVGNIGAGGGGQGAKDPPASDLDDPAVAALADLAQNTDDHPANSTTTGRLSLGGSVTGTVETAGDQDWFAIDLVAGQSYVFTLIGTSGGGGTLTDPYLRLFSSSGSLLAFNDDNGTVRDSLITFTATASGRHFLSAGGFSTTTGTYRLTAGGQQATPTDPDGPLGSNRPTDPLFASQWHLQSTAAGINVLPVWADYTGRGVRIGILDQGIDSQHRDLDGNYSSGTSINSTTARAGGTPVRTDDNHGTAVAGTAAAERNGYGGVGVAYNADLVSLYDPLAGTASQFATSVNNAFLHAIRNVDVLNNSWGFGNNFFSTPNSAFIDNFRTSPFNTSGALIARMAAEGRNGLGTVVVQSAGNSDRVGDDANLHNFQNSRFVITVAATDNQGRVASFSTPGSSILVAAPGVDIVTSDRTGAAGYSAAGDSTTISGTSFSAPIVSGVVALMLEANPRLGYRDVQEILALSARETDLTNAGWRTTGAQGWNGGGQRYNESLGFGLVDARSAVRLAESWWVQSTAANERVLSASRSQLSLTIPDATLTGVTDVVGLTGNLVVERVEVDLRLTHSYIGDLTVILTSPAGTSSFILDRPGRGDRSFFGSSQANVDFTFGIAAMRGESAAGTWRLTVIDNATTDVGTLQSWSLRVYGGRSTADDHLVFTDDFARLAGLNPARRTITDTDGGQDVLNAAAVSSTVRMDLGAGSATIAGQTVTLTPGAVEAAIGGDGADTLTGTAGDNWFQGARGNDTIAGGAGTDTAVFLGARSAYRIVQDGGTTRVTHLNNGTDGEDTLTGIELIRFADQTLALTTLTVSDVQVSEGTGGTRNALVSFTLASPALVAVTVQVTTVSGSAVAGQDFTAVTRTLTIAAGQTGASLSIAITGDGLMESSESFTVVASDLRGALFADGAGSRTVTVRILDDDGKPPAFVTAYAARNPDLFTAFGTDTDALIRHYIQYGRTEKRTATGFDVEAYAALNPDLFAAFGQDAGTLIRHYIQFGRAEGRATTGFSTESYAALNPDLLAAFGLDTGALITHYQQFGMREGRAASGFSMEAYAALNPDLFTVFGLDAEALVRHYVQFGRGEGRAITGFSAVEYAALNPDLFGVFGTDSAALVRHYVQFGRGEGRIAALDPGARLMALDADPLTLLGVTDGGWTG